ncbi:hypothetical protein RXV95_06675 [Novosphingobium sp. ZN18A2]|uniref:hypothetical protein n=1 Tax=Novosphingobium sp. ZN18A2 TaxID=3079861 RepID=UPI0030CFF8A6
MANSKALKAMAAGAAAIASLAIGGAAMAQAVIIRSTGPSAAQYPQGRKLPANATVTLKSGDRVTVLDKSGTRVLSGPGSFAMNGKVNRDGEGTSLASAILSSGSSRRTRTGAVRGAPVEQAPPGPGSVWYIDVSKGGTYCVADPSKLVLWRPNRTEEATATLTAADGTVADLVWKRGNALKLWPAATLPVVDGQTYTFSDPVGPAVKITTRLLGPLPPDPMEVAAKMGELGCNAQLDVMANAAAPAGSGGM